MLGNSGNIDEESMQNRFETSLLSHIPRTLQFRLYSLSPSEGLTFVDQPLTFTFFALTLYFLH